MKQAIEHLAVGVGREVGRRIELATGDAAEPAAACMQAFLGARYGNTVARAVADATSRDFTIDPAKAAASVTPGAVLAEGSTAIAGLVILIVRRQLATLAGRIASRLVGIALGRIVATVAGGIGLLLIAKDVWDFRHGVMPIIADEMKSLETRDKVQDELAKAIGEQIGDHVREIGAKTADRVIEIWHEFRRAHAKVLEIAERDPAFKRFLDAVSPANLGRLDETVALILASESEAAIARRLADGTLVQSVEKLPEPAFQIARDLRSLEAGLKWSTLAGDLLGRVVNDEIHRRNAPETFTRAVLTRLLALDDRTAAGRLAAMTPGARDLLLELPDSELKRLARGLAENELASLAGYLGHLDRESAQFLTQRVAASPTRMQALAPDSVRAAVLASRDRKTALVTMLRGDGLLDLQHVLEDLRLTRESVIDVRLLWARHPVPALATGGLVLLVLMLLWRALFGRRPRRSTPMPEVSA